MFGAVDDKPFKYDVEKAKELLEKAGLKDGLSITLDVRNNQPYVGIAESIQQTMAKAGINVEILQGDGKLTTTKVRARKHQLALGIWGRIIGTHTLMPSHSPTTQIMVMK